MGPRRLTTTPTAPFPPFLCDKLFGPQILFEVFSSVFPPFLCLLAVVFGVDAEVETHSRRVCEACTYFSTVAAHFGVCGRAVRLS
jgi:hypothetical protein